MKITTYQETVAYLEGFIGKIVFKVDPETVKLHPPLDRMKILLSLLDNPQEKFKSILVGGTSGKGSTAYLISHILKTAGYKTGLTISPHLQKINERIQINGKSVSDEEFTVMVSSIVRTIELMQSTKVGAPSYFEILIAMAFLYFAEQKVDIAVVEVGMGGEFDATNTLYPLVAVLTNVSLDHTSVLGGTVQKIARTKAGIIKKAQSAKRKAQNYKDNLVVITGIRQPSVIKIVEEKCREVGARLYRLDKDFHFKIKKEIVGGMLFDLTTVSDRALQLNDLKLSLLGKYQAENASLAVETVLQLRKFGFKVSEDHIRRALKSAFFPGRFEIVKIDSLLRRASSFDMLRTNPERSRMGSLAQDKTSSTLVLDGAHNPTKMKAFLKTLKKLYPKNPKIFIVAFKNDKDIKSMLSQILKLADKVIITEFTAKTDMSKNASAGALNLKSQISRLAEAPAKRANLKTDAGVFVEKDPKRALQNAIRASAVQQYNNLPRRPLRPASPPASPRGESLGGREASKAGPTIVVVTGSLYLVGEVRNML